MKSKVKVIDSLWTFAVAVAFAGPFALPLLWRNPRFSIRTKLLGSVFILVLTGALLWMTEVIFKDTYNRIHEFQELQRQSQKQSESSESSESNETTPQYPPTKDTAN